MSAGVAILAPAAVGKEPANLLFLGTPPVQLERVEGGGDHLTRTRVHPTRIPGLLGELHGSQRSSTSCHFMSSSLTASGPDCSPLHGIRISCYPLHLLHQVHFLERPPRTFRHVPTSTSSSLPSRKRCDHRKTSPFDRLGRNIDQQTSGSLPKSTYTPQFFTPTSPKTQQNLVFYLLKYGFCMTISSKMRSWTCRI